MRKKTVVAIGVFDGVHLGHQKILKQAVKIAKRFGVRSLAITFDPHPASVLGPKSEPPFLVSVKHRVELIRRLGIDRCVIFNFTKDFAGMTGEYFVKNILVKKLNAGWVVVGEDFYFGKAKAAGVSFLKIAGRQYGFKTVQLKKVRHGKIEISSSFIRRLIRSGSLDFAKKLLGRPVVVLGTVVRGRKIGETLGFPTANINPHHEAVPPSGVYAVFAKVGKRCYNAVLNIGVRPTFYGTHSRDKEPAIEAHIFEFSNNIYGRDVEISFVKKIRPEKKFASKELLMQQIEKDVKRTKNILKETECRTIFVKNTTI